MGNALKFTGAGGRVALTSQVDNEKGVTITVADNGIGIPKEDLVRVFG
ncbi:ATP-binding protein, partial [Klebsiella pneumoniae]